MHVESHGGMILIQEDLSTRALRQFYQQSNVVAKQEKHGEEMRNLSTKYLFSYS
jgi:hypothetical protein